MIKVSRIRQYQKKAFFYVFFIGIVFFLAIIIFLGFSFAQTGTEIVANYKSGAIEKQHSSAKEETNINLSPLYSSVENGQGVMFAGCENSVNVDVKSKKIKELHIEIEYNIEDLSVDKVLLTNPTPKTRYRIENNQIIYTQKSKSDSFLHFDGTVFSFVLQSKMNISKSDLKISPKSYIIDENGNKIFLSQKITKLTFSEVGECNPDVIAPFISLISPKDGSNGNKIDVPVVIKVTDNKAGVDWTSLDIELDGLHYKIGDENVKKDKNIVTIKPVLEFTYGKSIELAVKVQDKNSSKPNKTQQIFSFGITKDTPMCKELGCATSLGRQISKKECVQFQKMFLYSDEVGQKAMKKLFGDLQFKCNLDNIEVLKKIANKDDRHLRRVDKAKTVSFNLFSMLGWVLFAVSFVLKLWYMRQYRKFKKYKKKYE